MTNIYQKCSPIILITLGALLVLELALFLREANISLAGNAGNLPAQIATSTTYVVNTTVPLNPHIATSTFCSARIITTGTSSVRMIMTNRHGQRPSDSVGIFQSASTTTAYPAENYGCGATWVYGHTGDSTLSIQESF